MKDLIKYISCFFIGIIGLSLASCTNDEEGGSMEDELVEVSPVMPGYYPFLQPDKSVRSATPTDMMLAGKSPLLLEDGSTLRLLVYNKNSSNTYELLSDYSKAYVIRTVGGSSLLYPCEVDADGNPVSYDAAPLYMPAGTYYFRILSPAKPLNDKGFVNINNGEYLLATDDRYEQTQMKAHEIIKTLDATVQTLMLQPIINQTARIMFNIKTGEGVHSLEMLSEGIEISGIQPWDDNASFDWPNGGVIPVKIGDKSASVRIKEAVHNADNSLTAHTGVMPTDARSHSIAVLLNLRVNGNPTQYQMLLNDMLLEAGHSYNYVITVTINDGVTVLTWQNRTWTEEVEMTTTNS